MFFQGALDYVTGYAVTENGMIHCASRLYDANGTNIIGSSFYFIQPDDGSAKDFGTLKHNGNENDPALYGGYHRSVDVTGTKAYRLGYKSVVMQASPGMSVVTNGYGSFFSSSFSFFHSFFLFFFFPETLDPDTNFQIIFFSSSSSPLSSSSSSS